MSDRIGVYLEVGHKLTHAIAPDWPGWSRSGRDEASALDALLGFGPRYAVALQLGGVEFTPPERIGDLEVIDRLPGGAGADFGVPDVVLPGDELPLDSAALARSEAILQACWRALDRAAAMAEGKTLRVGPRGGGRTLDRMLAHVREVESAYTGAMGVKLPAGVDDACAREALIRGLEAVVSGEVPATGPRGGKRWSPRYFVRRLAWHELYHAWATEDRIT